MRDIPIAPANFYHIFNRGVDRQKIFFNPGNLNPVAAGLVEKPEHWDYSSYRDFIALREDPLPAIDLILEQFPSPQAYAEFVCERQVTNKGLPEVLKID